MKTQHGNLKVEAGMVASPAGEKKSDGFLKGRFFYHFYNNEEIQISSQNETFLYNLAYEAGRGKYEDRINKLSKRLSRAGIELTESEAVFVDNILGVVESRLAEQVESAPAGFRYRNAFASHERISDLMRSFSSRYNLKSSSSGLVQSTPTIADLSTLVNISSLPIKTRSAGSKFKFAVATALGVAGIGAYFLFSGCTKAPRRQSVGLDNPLVNLQKSNLVLTVERDSAKQDANWWSNELSKVESTYRKKVNDLNLENVDLTEKNIELRTRNGLYSSKSQSAVSPRVVQQVQSANDQTNQNSQTSLTNANVAPLTTVVKTNHYHVLRSPHDTSNQSYPSMGVQTNSVTQTSTNSVKSTQLRVFRSPHDVSNQSYQRMKVQTNNVPQVSTNLVAPSNPLGFNSFRSPKDSSSDYNKRMVRHSHVNGNQTNLVDRITGDVDQYRKYSLTQGSRKPLQSLDQATGSFVDASVDVASAFSFSYGVDKFKSLREDDFSFKKPAKKLWRSIGDFFLGFGGPFSDKDAYKGLNLVTGTIKYLGSPVVNGLNVGVNVVNTPTAGLANNIIVPVLSLEQDGLETGKHLAQSGLNAVVRTPVRAFTSNTNSVADKVVDWSVMVLPEYLSNVGEFEGFGNAGHMQQSVKDKGNTGVTAEFLGDAALLGSSINKSLSEEQKSRVNGGDNGGPGEGHLSGGDSGGVGEVPR